MRRKLITEDILCRGLPLVTLWLLCARPATYVAGKMPQARIGLAENNSFACNRDLLGGRGMGTAAVCEEQKAANFFGHVTKSVRGNQCSGVCQFDALCNPASWDLPHA